MPKFPLIMFKFPVALHKFGILNAQIYHTHGKYSHKGQVILD